MDLFDPAIWQSVKSGISTLRDAIGLAKDAKSLLPDSPQAKSAEAALEKAENSIALAEAQIAQALGYPLCRCSFPPKIMLRDRKHERRDVEIYRCSSCQNQHPSEAHFRQLDEVDASISRSLSMKADWRV